MPACDARDVVRFDRAERNFLYVKSIEAIKTINFICYKGLFRIVPKLDRLSFQSDFRRFINPVRQYRSAETECP